MACLVTLLSREEVEEVRGRQKGLSTLRAPEGRQAEEGGVD